MTESAYTEFTFYDSDILSIGIASDGFHWVHLKDQGEAGKIVCHYYGVEFIKKLPEMAFEASRCYAQYLKYFMEIQKFSTSFNDTQDAVDALADKLYLSIYERKGESL